MRFLPILPHVFCSLFIVCGVYGCSGSRILSIERAPASYLLYEHGQLKHFAVIKVREKHWVPGDATVSERYYLTDGQVPTKSTLEQFQQTVPPHRRILSSCHIPNLAPVLVETGGNASDVLEMNSSVKWVIGISPVMVAIGDRTEREWQGAFGGGGYFQGKQARVSGNYIFASEADFRENVTELIILEQWPTAFPPDELGMSPHKPISLDSALGAEVKRHLRRIPLARGTTLEEVMNNPSLWGK